MPQQTLGPGWSNRSAAASELWRRSCFAVPGKPIATVATFGAWLADAGVSRLKKAIVLALIIILIVIIIIIFFFFVRVLCEGVAGIRP